MIEQFTDIAKRLKWGKREEPHYSLFTAAQLPYCQAQHFFYRMNNKNPPTVEYWRKRDFYFNVSAAIKETVISWMLEDDMAVYGQWECEACGHTELCTATPQCCNDDMMFCGLDWTIPDSEFKGHCDGILQLEDDQFVFEVAACNVVPTPDQIPLKFQLKAAAHLYAMRNIHKVNVRPEIAILYVPRNDIGKLEWVLFEPDHIPTIKHFIKQNRKLMDIIYTGAELNIRGICAARVDAGDCPYADICFNPDRDKIIQDIWQSF